MGQRPASLRTSGCFRHGVIAALPARRHSFLVHLFSSNTARRPARPPGRPRRPPPRPFVTPVAAATTASLGHFLRGRAALSPRRRPLRRAEDVCRPGIRLAPSAAATVACPVLCQASRASHSGTRDGAAAAAVPAGRPDKRNLKSGRRPAIDDTRPPIDAPRPCACLASGGAPGGNCPAGRTSRAGRPRADLLAQPPLASSRRAGFDVREPAAHTRTPHTAPPPLAGRVATPSTAMPGSAAAVTPGLWVRLAVVRCGSVCFGVLGHCRGLRGAVQPQPPRGRWYPFSDQNQCVGPTVSASSQRARMYSSGWQDLGAGTPIVCVSC